MVLYAAVSADSCICIEVLCCKAKSRSARARLSSTSNCGTDHCPGAHGPEPAPAEDGLCGASCPAYAPPRGVGVVARLSSPGPCCDPTCTRFLEYQPPRLACRGLRVCAHKLKPWRIRDRSSHSHIMVPHACCRVCVVRINKHSRSKVQITAAGRSLTTVSCIQHAECQSLFLCMVV